MGWQLREGVSNAETEYGSVLLDERSGEYFQLNATGTLVIRLLLAGDSPAQAAEALSETFEVDPPTALVDVNALVAELEAARLVMVTP